jgi:hypothetical protein
VRAPGGGSAGSLQGPSAAAAVLSPIPAETAPKIIQLLAVDRVAVATGPKLFVDQIEADIGQSYGVSHSTISRLLTSGWGIKLEGRIPHPGHRQSGCEAAMPVADRRIAHRRISETAVGASGGTFA